jgi:hypothetical protein
MATTTDRVNARVTGRGWAYIGAALGGLMSIAANVAHSYVPPPDAGPAWSPPLGAVVGAIFWPVALFVAVEIFARTAWPEGKRWTALRFLGLLPVALVAAVVSYRHLSGLLTFYREDPLTATIGPLAVDGLMVMATAALIATAARRGTSVVLDTPTAPDAPSASDAPTAAPVVAAPSEPVPVAEDAAPADPAPSPNRNGKPVTRPARGSRTSRRPPSADKVAKAAARMPGATIAQIAARAGVSETTARRRLADLARSAGDATVPSPNGASSAQTPVLADAA